MKIISTVSMLVLLLFISACSTMESSLTSDVSFETDLDSTADFKKYHSYMWIESSSIMNDPYGQWEPPGFDADAEIKFIINRELQAKGMSEALQNPDVLVGYAAGINMTHVEYKENPNTKFKSLQAAPKGSLAIIVVDADTGVIVWASTARADMKGLKDQNRKKRIDYAVTGMLKKFPK